MFVSKKMWAITVPLVFLFCFSSPVRAEMDSIRWEDLPEHLAQESIPLLELNVNDCPKDIEDLEPSRVVAQIIENTFYLWEEYEILTDDSIETVCIVMKKPNPGPLSKKESQVLLTASSRWTESKPRPEDVIILDASDPSLDLPPIEDLYTDRDVSIQPENVIGTDNRTRITNTTTYPWKTHCYLHLNFPSGGYRGTGCLVSSYMVLTCGHNVYDKGPPSVYVDDVTIAPGQRQDYAGGPVTRPYGTREGVEFQTNSSYIGGGSWEHDYAAVFFCTPFSGISTFIPVQYSYSSPSEGDTVCVAGYPKVVQGESNSQALWDGCGLVHSFTTSEILRYTADSSGGQSGSPVRWAGVIAAVHAFGSSTYNGGPRTRPNNETLITQWMQYTPDCPRPCEDCEPEDENLGTIGTSPWYSISGNCGNGGKWVGQFTGEAGATYHFDLCPDSPGSGIANFDADIKITNSSCSILDGEDGSCSSPLFSPNDFQWTCPANGTYYVIIAPYDSYDSHTCEGTASHTFTLEYYSVKDEGDAYEPDNTAVQANEILPDSPQTHSIAPVGDVDYVRFSLDLESEVVIETSGLSGDTQMWLYDDQENQIDYDDDGGTGLFSRIERTTCGIDALSAGTYYVKVAEYGNNAKIDSYEIILTVTPCLEVPFLHAEPNITPGLCNIISWDVVPEANEYYAECSSDPCFSIVDSNSGWIADTSYEFCGLTSGETYWYRVKAGFSGIESAWSNVVSSRQCGTPGDFEPDCDVDYKDLEFFTFYWLYTDCNDTGGDATDWCYGTDIDQDSNVGFCDFAMLANYWLEGISEPFYEDFNDGLPVDGWDYYSSDGGGRIQVVNGRLRMDRDPSGTYTLNEAVLHLDLEGQSNVVLAFFQAESGDEVHSLPATFTGHENGDGVSVSNDGITWYQVVNASELDVGTGGQIFTVNLDDVGIAYTSDFRIKFQQYDNYPWSSDGREFDNIEVTFGGG